MDATLARYRAISRPLTRRLPEGGGATLCGADWLTYYHSSLAGGSVNRPPTILLAIYSRSRGADRSPSSNRYRLGDEFR